MSSDKEIDKFDDIAKEIECEKSFYLFSKKNILRKKVYKIVKHRFFDTCIITAIFVNSLVLIFDTFVDQIGTKSAEDASYYANLCFTILFTIESFMKALGI